MLINHKETRVSFFAAATFPHSIAYKYCVGAEENFSEMILKGPSK